MERRKFLQVCGMACMSGVVFQRFLHACASSPTFDKNEEDIILEVPKADFIRRMRRGKPVYRKNITATHPRLEFPIVVYRLEEDQYTALLLQCTHQGAPLQVFGDIMECNAHGSEFDYHGQVLEGPATTPLKSFPININQENIEILI